MNIYKVNCKYVIQKQQAPVTKTVFNIQYSQHIYFFKVLQFSGKVFMCTSIHDLLDSLYMYIVYKFNRLDKASIIKLKVWNNMIFLVLLNDP